MIFESIKTVLKNFQTNKGRTFLTMLGMIIGIFSITIIFSLADSTKSLMQQSINSIQTENIYLETYGENYINNELVEKDILEYLNKNNIKYNISSDFTPQEIINTIESSNSSDYYIPSFLAIDEKFLVNLSSEINLVAGKLLSNKDIVSKMQYTVIREDLAILLYGRNNVVGEILNIDNHEFEIIGVIKNNENLSPGILISYYYAKDYMNLVNNKYMIFTKPSEEKEIKKDLEKIVGNYLTAEEYFVYTENFEDAMESINTMVDIVGMVFAGIAGLSILVGGIGIMNIMLVSVSERIKETGIRLALGAKNRNIIVQFLIEGIMITIFSGIIGILLATAVTNTINILTANSPYEDFKLIINFMTIVKIILFCGLIGIIFGLYPAIKASKLDPVEALKYE